MVVMRLFFLVSLWLSLSACSLSPSISAEKMVRDKVNASKDANYEYAIGQGKTKAKALQAAQLELSNRIYTQVHSEFQAVQKQVSDSGNTHSTVSTRDELQHLTASYTNTRLSNVKIVEQSPIRNKLKLNQGWVVAVKIPRSDMEKARIRAEQQAPALAYALLMNNPAKLPAGMLLRYAVLGLNKTIEQAINKEIIYAPGIPANTTYEAFFITAIEQAKKRLRVLPITDDNRVQFALIDSTTFRPQTDFAVYIEGHALKTNRSGLTPFLSIDALPEQFSPTLIGYSHILNSKIDKNLLKTDSINTTELNDFNQTAIYVYTEPKNSLTTLMNASKTLASQASPALFIVDSELTALKLSAETESATHGGFNELIAKPRSAILYYSIKLSEKSFGRLNLSISNIRNRITLKDSNDEIIASGSNVIKQQVEVGRYHVHIENDKADKYQSLDENITVYKNREFKRNYKELINRNEYFFGSFNDFNFGYAPAFNEDFELPMKNGSNIKAKRFIKDYNADYDYSYALNFRHMRLKENALAISSGLDFSTHHYNEDGTDNKAFLISYGAHLGLGVWKGLAANQVIWATANYNYSFYDWHFFDSDRNNPAARPKVDSFKRGYPFLDIGARWQTVGFGLRLSDPKFAAPLLYLSFGQTKTNSDYEHSAHSPAIEGEHF